MRRRKLPPGTRFHEYWCAIYRDRPCDCSDDDHRPPETRRPLGGGPAHKKEMEMEDA
jgi:hypothetical protein